MIPQHANVPEHPRLSPERQELLSRTLGRLLLADDPDVIIRELFPQVALHLGVDTYFNYMVHIPEELLRLHSSAGIPAQTAHEIRDLPFGSAICGTVARTRKAIVAEDIQRSDYDKAALVRGFGIQCYACNPLIVGDELLGTLSFASRNRPRFDPEELHFIQLVTHYTALAMYRLRTQRRLDENMREAQQLARSLSEMDERKNEFIAVLSHELRNPLMPLSSALNVLRMKNVPAQDKDEMLSLMERQMRHMVRLVDDLMDVSRIANGRLQLRLEDVDLLSCVRMAVEMSQPHLDHAGVQLHLEMGDTPVQVNGDPLRLAQIFTNLLNNAAKFSARSAPVHVRVERSASEVSVSVRDEGVGIPQAMLGHVFDLFHQVQSTIERSHDGLGVGLALVKHLVEAHGGTVSVMSDGAGCTFRVRLPVAA